jgi:hypothetical protein
VTDVERPLDEGFQVDSTQFRCCRQTGIATKKAPLNLSFGEIDVTLGRTNVSTAPCSAQAYSIT